MKKTINKISDVVYYAYLAVACLLVVVLTAASAVQVIFRYFVNDSQAWTEETARYCFIWASMLGAACLVKTGGHAVVDFVMKGLKGKAKAAQQVIVVLVMFAFGVLLIAKGAPLLSIVAQQKSSVLKLPMSLIYLSVPVCGFGICIHALNQLVNICFGQEKDSERAVPEETADAAEEMKGE